METQTISRLTESESPITSETESLPSQGLHNINPPSISEDESESERLCYVNSHRSKESLKDDLLPIQSNSNKVDAKTTVEQYAHFLNDKSIMNNLNLRESDSKLVLYSNSYQSSIKDRPKLGQSKPNEKSTHVNVKKVQFQTMENQGQSSAAMSLGGLSIDGNNFHELFNSSHASSHSTEAFTQGFDEIKNLLRSDVEELAVTDSSGLSSIYSQKLNIQKQRNKDLEDQLALNDASLVKLTKELEIVQNRLQRRETQLKTVSQQVEKLQIELKTSHKQISSSRDYYKNQNQQYKNILEKWNVERNELIQENSELQAKCQNYGTLQIQAEEMQIQLRNRAKQENEIIEENKKIMDELNECKKSLFHFEKKYIPELEELRRSNIEKQKDVETLTTDKKELETEISFSKMRIEVLSKMALKDEEAKKEVEQLKKSYDCKISEMKTLMQQQYQEKFDYLILDKTNQLQEQFHQTKEELKAKYDDNLEQKNKEHKGELEQLHRDLLKENELIRQSERKLSLKVKTLSQEKQILEKQQKVIRQAISSFPPEKCENNVFEPSDISLRIPQQRATPQRKKFRDRPLITSTSLSNDENPEESPRRELNRNRQKQGSKKNVANGKRFLEYKDLLNSMDSEYSRRDPLGHLYADRPTTQHHEIPRHDTSVEELRIANRR